MKKIAVALILTIFSSGAYSEDWVEVGDTKGMDTYIDADSIKDEWPDQKIFWVLQKSHKAEKSPNNKLYTVMRYRINIDCVKETWFPMEEFYYTKKGNVVDQDLRKGEKEILVPGTLAQQWKEYVCE